MTITNEEMFELVDSDADDAVYFLRWERERLMELLTEARSEIDAWGSDDLRKRIDAMLKGWTPEPAFAETR